MTYKSIEIRITCTCDNEEHTLEFERDGSGGIAEGDVLPCGRVADRELVDEAMRAFAEHGYE